MARQKKPVHRVQMTDGKRNITILTGDSGSGKTVLIDLIRDYRRFAFRLRIFPCPGRAKAAYLHYS